MEKINLTITKASDILRVQEVLLALIEELKNGKTFDLSIENHREKRSLNANAYSWKLQSEIAKTLNRRLDDIHFEMIIQYGVVEVVSIKSSVYESAKRSFDYCQEIGRSKLNGEEFTHCKVGVGSHNYNSKEMATFIDGIVSECKNLDIPTLEDLKIKELIDKWNP